MEVLRNFSVVIGILVADRTAVMVAGIVTEQFQDPAEDGGVSVIDDLVKSFFRPAIP